MNFKNRPPLSQTDKLCLIALVGCFLAPCMSFWAMDAAAERAVEEDKPQVDIVEVVPPIDCTPLVEAVEAARESAESEEVAQSDPYDETIPLSRGLQTVLREACKEHGVAVCDALGVIEVESGFKADADNGVSIGLMQTNEKYASKFEEATGYSIYTPDGNIRGGVWYLGTLLKQYDGDIQAALTSYNAGHDTGDRGYARRVLDASEKWGCG